MKIRTPLMKSEQFGDDLPKIFPILNESNSDSGVLDNALQFLTMNGKTLPEAIVTLVPEAWQNDKHMDDEKKSFYEFHSALMEPWDGPALLVFSDTQYAGALLDRNGLRPARIWETTDDKVILGSEVHTFPILESHPHFVDPFL